ncbi:39S ribosomal protein L3, mitochondrial [Ceratina calcarata]|uniref:Large ribosomal subunit protein uL3m n=1 Tax=Ceratina calcarata TaxID=156304 RepID=A0AAJ7JGA6_9HYME|nr:39S ribosomal protein L3, mitochondrial [Ceratina calcarata]XP_017892200.1 39S ribosomal protein L3, mitochondrial [Ceratina calcarata]XP_026671008.1 39S ribosomal protein L3, mitochondrial [Ceratina calcarata]
MASILKTINGFQLFNKCLTRSLDVITVPSRGKRMNPAPKKRHPEWLPKPTRVLYNEGLTSENKEFLNEVVAQNLASQSLKSPLNAELVQSTQTWTNGSKRTGLIGKKIGVYPMWLKNGRKVLTTLIQIIDNEVVKYIPPEEYNPVVKSKHPNVRVKNGCLVLGAVNIDPQKITKAYSGIFDTAGVTPKKTLMRFTISPNAALEPGTPLSACHFKPGDYLDIRGKTIDRGFQGVMKRWGFHGMPASHGVTKTHRRPGNIGSGGEMARVRPGTKMPGHMGNHWRILRGVKILRINTKYNVIWVLAQNVPGETNTMCYLYDTVLPTRKNESPHFPTYFPNEKTGEELPENLYADDVQPFDAPTIEFQPESS